MKFRIIRPFAAVFAVLFILVAHGCDSGLKTLPPELIGRWECLSERFEGFSFELTRDSLIFRDENAEDPTEENRIQKITSEKKKERNPLYTIHYRDKEGVKLTFAFYYDTYGGGIIRLRNQEIHLWKRVPQKPQGKIAKGSGPSN